MIPDTPNDFLASLPKDLEALYDWAAVIGDEAYNTMSVASELNLGDPEDFREIASGMDTIKDKLTSLKALVSNLTTNRKQEESK